ncbi:hypothetical protein HJC23_010621 [Cyclotella cryptica]|uniref:SMODS and SLOG-associating 2TM effector domain-containing protein n=1 Tax=Cyclotella cryptica TaxID=29204 RepID=A0ABD3NKH1_9STRA|eukprot:CCRYP_020660-RA/>CCRYP_020660-RA protein AED:0.00 eAED:0.00 QI:190/-1/1/1/-1/1/1/593/320
MTTPKQSQEVHRNTSIDVSPACDDESVERIELCIVTRRDGDPTDGRNRITVSSLEDLKAAIALLEGQVKLRKVRDATRSPILHSSSEEATVGQNQKLERQRGTETDRDNSSDEDRVRTFRSDAMADFGPNYSERIHTTQRAFLDEVKRFELFRSVIQHEDDLLNQRVSWIILAQSFLMAAFITNTSDDGSGNALKYIAATVGLLTVVVTMPAILAAGRNIELQQHVYFAHISSEQRCKELHGHGRFIIKGMGGSEYKYDFATEQEERANFGHIFPNMAFRGRGALSALNTVIALATVQVLGWCFLLAALVREGNSHSSDK